MVGYQKILTLPLINTTGIRIVFKEYREFPTITAINVN